MTFLPKRDLLTLEELDRLCSALRRHGRRASCASPAASRWCAGTSCGCSERSARHLGSGGLDELTLTTNGSQLANASRGELKAAGVAAHQRLARHARRPTRFRAITRWGDLGDGAGRHRRGATTAGLKVKINAVALKGVNEDEFDDLIALCARPRLRPDADRDHADGRDRRRPHRPVPAAVDRARAPAGPLDARGHSATAPAARRATCACARPAAGSASSRR